MPRSSVVKKNSKSIIVVAAVNDLAVAVASGTDLLLLLPLLPCLPDQIYGLCVVAVVIVVFQIDSNAFGLAALPLNGQLSRPEVFHKRLSESWDADVGVMAKGLCELVHAVVGLLAERVQVWLE